MHARKLHFPCSHTVTKRKYSISLCAFEGTACVPSPAVFADCKSQLFCKLTTFVPSTLILSIPTHPLLMYHHELEFLQVPLSPPSPVQVPPSLPSPVQVPPSLPSPVQVLPSSCRVTRSSESGGGGRRGDILFYQDTGSGPLDHTLWSLLLVVSWWFSGGFHHQHCLI